MVIHFNKESDQSVLEQAGLKVKPCRVVEGKKGIGAVLSKAAAALSRIPAFLTGRLLRDNETKAYYYVTKKKLSRYKQDNQINSLRNQPTLLNLIRNKTLPSARELPPLNQGVETVSPQVNTTLTTQENEGVSTPIQRISRESEVPTMKQDPEWKSMDKSQLSEYVKENMDTIIKSDIGEIETLIDNMKELGVDFGVRDSSGSTLLMKLFTKPVPIINGAKVGTVISELIDKMTPDKLAIQRDGKHALQLLMEDENKSTTLFPLYVGKLIDKLPCKELESITDEQISKAASAFSKTNSDLLKLRVHGKILALGGLVDLEKLFGLAVKNYNNQFYKSECDAITRAILAKSEQITSSMQSELEKVPDLFKTRLEKMSQEEVQDYLKNNLGRLFTLSEAHRSAIYECMVKRLDINTFRDKDGKTCLMLAITSDIKNESKNVMETTKDDWLWKLSSDNNDLSIKNNDGKTALEMVLEQENPNSDILYQLLKKTPTKDLYEMRDKLQLKGADEWSQQHLKEFIQQFITPFEKVYSNENKHDEIVTALLDLAVRVEIELLPKDSIQIAQEEIKKAIENATQDELTQILILLNAKKEKTTNNWRKPHEFTLEMLELVNKRQQELNTK